MLRPTPKSLGYAFPPEWARHSGTWISGPRPEGIAQFELVHLNVPNANYRHIVRDVLDVRGVPLRRIRFHEIPTNECWTRDHGPAFVLRTRRGRTEAAVVDWGFNAWGGKYPPYDDDDAVPTRVAEELRMPVFHPGVVMEGGDRCSAGCA